MYQLASQIGTHSVCFYVNLNPRRIASTLEVTIYIQIYIRHFTGYIYLWQSIYYRSISSIYYIFDMYVKNAL